MKEIFGCWTIEKHKKLCQCDICGTRLVEVPKHGHPNSHYWKPQKMNDDILMYCPKNCLIGKDTFYHDWKKRNAVTQEDRHGLHDIYKCSKCGMVTKRYGLINLHELGCTK